MEGWPFTAIGVIGFQCGSGFGIFNDGINPCPDLLHNSKVGIKLFLHQLFGGKLCIVLFANFEILYLARQKVIIGFHRRATRGYFGKSASSGDSPAGFLRPSLFFFLGSLTLIADIN